MGRVLSIPIIFFSDGFGFLTRPSIRGSAMAAFIRVADLLVLRFKLSKTPIVNEVVYLRLFGNFQAADSFRRQAISHPSDTISKIVGLITGAITRKHISHDSIERLIGALNFSTTATYNRSERATLNPLYRKLFAYPYYTNLKEGTIRALTRRPTTIQAISTGWLSIALHISTI